MKFDTRPTGFLYTFQKAARLIGTAFTGREAIINGRAPGNVRNEASTLNSR